jgi:hypothetical protein
MSGYLVQYQIILEYHTQTPEQCAARLASALSEYRAKVAGESFILSVNLMLIKI